MTPTGLRRTRVAVAGAFAAQGLLFAVLLTHLPQFKDRWGIGDGVITVVILTVSILAAVGSVLTEALARRRGSAVALLMALAVIVLATLAIAAAPARAVFFLGFAVYGVGLGGVDAAGNMQAVAVQHRYGRSILTSFHATWSAAGILGALYVAGGERVHLPLGASIAAASVLVGVAAVAMRPRLLRSATAATRHGGATQNGSSTQDGAADDGSAAPVGDVPWRPVLLLGSAMACFYVADGGTSNWSAVYLHDGLHASDSVAALAYAAYQGTSLLSRIGGDLVVRRQGAVRTVRAGAALGVVGLLVAITAPGPAVAIIGFAVLGAGITVTAPLCFSAAGQLAPDAVDAVIARVNIFNYVGALIGGVAVGAIGALSSVRIGFIVPLVLVAVLFPLSRAFAATRQPEEKSEESSNR